MLLLLDESKTELLTELLTSALIAPPAFTPAVNVTGGGAGGGSLQAGTYFGKVTYVTANGETTAGPEFTFTSASGNQPQLTDVPSPLPGGVQSLNVYLTAAGGGTGTETRYKTGVTANANSTFSAAQSAGAALPGANTATWPPTIQLRLYQNNLAYLETHTFSSYTEAGFTGYAAVPLARGTGGSPWTLAVNAPTGGWAPTDQSANTNVAEATTAQQTWNATSAQTVFGYYYSVANLAGVNVSLGSEAFASSIALTNPSSLSLTPRLGVAAA